MALKLLIEPGQGYHVTDAQVRRWVPPAPVAAVSAPARVRQLGALEELVEAGRLRKVQLDAGREIREYWRVWTIAFTAGIANYTGERSGGGAEPASLRGVVDRYRTWSAWAEGQRVRGDLSRLQITLDLCLRDSLPWRLRQEYRIAGPRALRLVQESLLEYGRLAGWEVDRKAA